MVSYFILYTYIIMNKKIVFSGLMMLVLLASCWAKDVTTSIDTVSNIVTETSTPVDTSIAVEVDEPVVLSQGFVEYDESYIGETANTVLFFHQESCGTCKTTEANLIETGAWSDITVLKVDFDDSANDDLRAKYGVTMKHTFVEVDANGDMLKKWNGSLTIDDIIEQISEDKMMEDESEEVMMEKEADTMMKDDSELMEKDGETMMDKSEEGEVMEKVELAGIYAEYDSSLVGENDTTVLAFFAAWCPSCVAADTAISTEEVPDGLSILKVDYDTATNLRQEYGVITQHTYVQVDADGNLVKKWAGGTTVDDIVSRIQ